MRPMRKPGLVSRIVDGEAVVVDRATDQVHRLNLTATCIWDQCDGSRSPEEIAGVVASTFDGTPDQVLEDTLRTLGDLQRLGLLSLESPSH
jgi:Coenzyme PQQ synthesis protein D (PqqD)